MTGRSPVSRWTLISLILLVSLFFARISLAEEKPIWWEQAELEAESEGYLLITPEELKGMNESGKPFLIVDVRPDYEYKRGHIVNAMNLEFHLGERLTLDPAKQRAFETLLGSDKDRTIVIYCRSFR
jgi:3-mercaptopyruvate sulfurtransferase SseA